MTTPKVFLGTDIKPVAPSSIKFVASSGSVPIKLVASSESPPMKFVASSDSELTLDCDSSSGVTSSLLVLAKLTSLLLEFTELGSPADNTSISEPVEIVL